MNETNSSPEKEEPSKNPEEGNQPIPENDAVGVTIPGTGTESNSTETNNPQTDIMEVHHHPHVHHHSRKWNEYLIEFIMLFLAVSLGFVAENIREVRVEHHRSEVLAASLYEDFKKDTLNINVLLKDAIVRQHCIDTLTNMLTGKEPWKDTVAYRCLAPLCRVFKFDRTDQTFQQIKNSGALRYFKQSLINELNRYDVQSTKCQYTDKIHDELAAQQIVPFLLEHFNFQIIRSIWLKEPINAPLFFEGNNQLTKIKLINFLNIQYSNYSFYSQRYTALQKTGIKILSTIKEQYHLGE